jgi:hypothetical protein
MYNFVKFVATKKGMTTIFFHPSLLLLFWIRDPGPEIRDKHPGSATLTTLGFSLFSFLIVCRP